MVFSSEINCFGRQSFWYALPSQLTPATLSAPSPTTAPFQARSLLLSTAARRKSGATATVCGAQSTSFVADDAADRRGVAQGPGETGELQKTHPNPFPHPHMPLCASLRPLVESAPAASHSSISQFASSSNPLLAAHDWWQSEHLLIGMRSESRRSSAPEQAVANERVPKLCAHGDAPNEGTTGFEPPCALMWPLEVGVLRGGMGAAAAAAAEGACQRQQQQQQQQQQARARPAVARARRPCAVWVHMRAHVAIGTTAQPSSPSACRLPAGPSSSVSCSIRHG